MHTGISNQEAVVVELKVTMHTGISYQEAVLLRDLKWINFNSILQLNEASFMYKNLYVSADSNVKKINFDLRKRYHRE